MQFHNPTIQEVLKALNPSKTNVLLLGEHSSLDVPQLIAELPKGIKLVGGLFPMVLSHGKALEDGVLLKTLDQDVDPLLVDMKNDQVGLPELPSDTKTCMLFLDGLSANTPDFLEKIYGQYGSNLHYFGGGAGSLTLTQKPCVFDNTGIYQDKALLLFSTSKINLGVTHGWEKIEGPFIANKTEGNTILELNWRPAFEVYKEVVEAHSGRSFAEEEFFNIAKGYPFGIFKENREDIVRDPIAVGESGELFCVGQVSAHTPLNILKGNPENLIRSAHQAAKKSINKQVKDVWVVDCISRILFLEENFSQELLTINVELAENGLDLPLEGVLSLGEISSDDDGLLEFYNKTTVVASLE